MVLLKTLVLSDVVLHHWASCCLRFEGLKCLHIQVQAGLFGPEVEGTGTTCPTTQHHIAEECILQEFLVFLYGGCLYVYCNQIEEAGMAVGWMTTRSAFRSAVEHTEPPRVIVGY